MNNLNRAKSLHRALVAARIPPDRRCRLLTEYADHRESLAEELRHEDLSGEALDEAIEQRLGEPQQLAELARRQLQNESLCGRHPRIGFGLLPGLSFVLAYPLIALAIMGIDILFDIPDRRTASALELVMPLALYILPVIGGVWWYRSALRRGLGICYAWVAALSFGIPAAFLRASVVRSDIEGESQFMVDSTLVPSFALAFVVMACVLFGAWLKGQDDRSLEAR